MTPSLFVGAPRRAGPVMIRDERLRFTTVARRAWPHGHFDGAGRIGARPVDDRGDVPDPYL